MGTSCVHQVMHEKNKNLNAEIRYSCVVPSTNYGWNATERLLQRCLKVPSVLEGYLAPGARL